ncbi:MAG: DUF1311 domain-containing protein [Alphaproteobacteria bacterium]|nr:MAG: DUF1311 domain-containing protein [Alphaproteobacteria bacterium]
MRTCLFIALLIAVLPGTASSVLADDSKPFPGDPNDPALLPELIQDPSLQEGGSGTRGQPAGKSGWVKKVGPSFNCNYAKIPAEVAICNSPELAELDRRMAQLYFAKRNSSITSAMRGQLKRFQKRWLRHRNACGYDIACLKRSHLEQIQSLNNWPY